MTIILSALAAAFAAFCVWLTVRIVNRREWWVKRTLAATIGLPVLYVGSFGPACRMHLQLPGMDTPTSIKWAYKPVVYVWNNGPAPAQRALSWYAGFDDDDEFDTWLQAALGTCEP